MKVKIDGNQNDENVDEGGFVKCGLPYGIYLMNPKVDAISYDVYLWYLP